MADWSLDEVEAAVSDYFVMLRKELTGVTYSKASHNEKLRERLAGQARPSVEFKHRNVSAVLVNSPHMPFIAGYKPLYNYQQLLEKAVLGYLRIRAHVLRAAGLWARPVTGRGGSCLALWLGNAPRGSSGGILLARSEDEPSVSVSKFDFVRRDAENTTLGLLGEEWVLEFEAKRLVDSAQRADLANANRVVVAG